MSAARFAFVLALSVTLPAALHGQRPDSAAARDSLARPFVRGGIYDKPHQTRLLGRTAFGGYAEAHARWQQVEGLQDHAGFEAKRFNLFANSRVSDVVRLAAELEFEEGGKEVKLEFAAIDLAIHPAITLRGGMILSPLGRFNLSHDSPLNEFTDRPLVSTEVLGVALSEPGFGLLGQLGVGATARLTYEAYATNGFHEGLITDAEEGTRIPRGRGNFEDNNGSPAFVGRVALSPTVRHEVGLSMHRGAYNAFNIEGTAVDERRDVHIAVFDAETEVLGVRLAGEAVRARIDVSPGLLGIYATRQHGWYVEGTRDLGRGWLRALPSSIFAAKLRWDYVDFDADVRGRSSGQMTAGFNFRPTPESVLKLDYVRGRGRDEFNNRADHAFVLASLATYF